MFPNYYNILQSFENIGIEFIYLFILKQYYFHINIWKSNIILSIFHYFVYTLFLQNNKKLYDAILYILLCNRFLSYLKNVK